MAATRYQGMRLVISGLTAAAVVAGTVYFTGTVAPAEEAVSTPDVVNLAPAATTPSPATGTSAAPTATAQATATPTAKAQTTTTRRSRAS
jgi:hypothetical protein